MEPALGIEPRSARYEGAALPLCYAGMAASAGLEPATLALTRRCATIAPRGNVSAAGQDRTDLVRLKRSVPLHFGISGMVSRTPSTKLGHLDMLTIYKADQGAERFEL